MDLSNMTILLVDDNPVNLKVLKETLLCLEIGIKVSLSGEVALEMLKDFTPSLIILDIMMPGMDGFELCSKIREDEKFNNTPIMFVTALNDTESEKKGLDLGAVDFITKPINPTLVKARVKNTLELKYFQQVLENKVENSEKQFFQLFDNSPDAQLLIKFDNLKIQLANKAAEKMFGFSKDELCTMGPLDITPEFQPDGTNSYDYGMECYEKSLKGEISFFEWTHKSRDGNEFLCEVRLMLFPGNETLFRVSVFDISERKRNEEEISRANKYIESIMNSMPFSLIGVDEEFRITHWNDFVQNSSEKNSDDVVGKDLVSVLPQMKLEIDIIGESISKGVIKKRFKRSRITSRGTVYENITIFPLLSEGLNGAVILIDDITKEVDLQDRVVQSERMLSLGDLTAGVVHEITNPLAGIIQNSQSLLNRLTGNLRANIDAAEKFNLNLEAMNSYLEDRKILRMISSIKTSGLKASHIIKNLKSFTIKDKGTLSYNQVDGLVKQAIELAENDFSISSKVDFKTISKEINFQDDLPLILCEAAKIIQVLVNILRFSTKNISLNSGIDGVIEIKTFNRDGNVIIDITDNGIKIPKEDLKNIFKPYFESKSSREDWYYIALSDFIIHDIHNGKFRVSSEGNNRYEISLPSKEH